MDKPRIIDKLLKENDELIEIAIKDIVTAIGGSGHIFVPKELVGKYVTVTYKKEVKE